jgi:hypothetical protein
MSTPQRRGLAVVFAFVVVVLFFLIIDIGLLPLEDCSPDAALLFAGRPSYRGAFGLWACGGPISVALGVIVPLILFALATVLAVWPRK